MIQTLLDFKIPRRRSALVAIQFGGYEHLTDQPELETSNFPAILITDKKSEFVPDKWVQMVVQPPVAGDSARSQRAVKHLLHKYLPTFDYCLYIDNTVQLKKRPEEIIKKFSRRKSVFFYHSFNESLREEFSAVSTGLILERPKVLIDELTELRALARDPLRLRTLWTGMFLRNLRDKRLNRNFEDMNKFISRYSKRDQLAAPVFLHRSRSVEFHSLDNQDSPIHSWPHYNGRKESLRAHSAEFNHEFIPKLSAQDSAHLKVLRKMLLMYE